MSDVKHVSASLAEARGRLGPKPGDGDEPTEDEIEMIKRSAALEVSTLRWRQLVPSRFGQPLSSNFTEPVAEALDEWSSTSPLSNLLIYGPVGTGKTHAAFAAVRDPLHRCFDVAYWPVTEMFLSLRQDFDRGGSTMDELLGVHLLILDDLGAEKMSPWTVEILYTIVNRRWMDERPIVATTNLEPGDLEEWLGAGGRTFSRLVGNDAIPIRLTGQDRRRRHG